MSQQQRRSGSRTRTFPNRSRSTVVLRLAAGLRLQSPSPAQWLRDEPSPAPRSDFAASEADAFPRRSFGNEPDDASVVASRTDNSGRLVDALTARFPCHGAHCEASSGELWTSGPKRQISVAGSCVAQRVMRRTTGHASHKRIRGQRDAATLGSVDFVWATRRVFTRAFRLRVREIVAGAGLSVELPLQQEISGLPQGRIVERNFGM